MSRKSPTDKATDAGAGIAILKRRRDMNETRRDLEVREQVFMEIADERDRQNEKWGGVQDLPSYTYLAVAAEEFGEVAQAALHDEFGGDHAGTLRTELVQLGAVIVQWLEHIGLTEEGAE